MSSCDICCPVPITQFPASNENPALVLFPLPFVHGNQINIRKLGNRARLHIVILPFITLLRRITLVLEER